jgi:hypothetical protein
MLQSQHENIQNQAGEVMLMGEKECVIKLTEQEHGIVVNALYDKHNDLVRRKRPFDAVDQVLVKMLSARHKRRKQSNLDLTR